MVPIHDTDIAEERWSKAEWEHYELWEKVEHRLRRRKWIWIGATVFLFLILSSIPILVDRWPKWSALKYSRKLAEEISLVKRDAGLEHQAFRIRFQEGAGLNYIIEKMPHCSDAHGTAVRSGSLTLNPTHGVEFRVLSVEASRELGIPGVVEKFCYDPYLGSDASTSGDNLVGFAIAPVKDLTNKRTDRIAVVLLKGPSAEISFD